MGLADIFEGECEGRSRLKGLRPANSDIDTEGQKAIYNPASRHQILIVCREARVARGGV